MVLQILGSTLLLEYLAVLLSGWYFLIRLLLSIYGH